MTLGRIFGSAASPARTAMIAEPGAGVPVPSRARELPVDLPDEVTAVVPEFRSRRKAELLPPLRPALQSNAFDPTWCKRLARADWQSGFRWGVAAAVCGLCLVVLLALALMQAGSPQ